MFKKYDNIIHDIQNSYSETGCIYIDGVDFDAKTHSITFFLTDHDMEHIIEENVNFPEDDFNFINNHRAAFENYVHNIY